MRKIEITGCYDHEKNYHYTLLFGMIVPKDTAQLVDKKVMISRNKSHKNITPVSYHFSEWIKQFPIKKYKVKGFPVSKCVNIPRKNFIVKGIPVLKCVNIPECDPRVRRCGYNYLVRERENVNTNTNVYKFGMTVQEPDNIIHRIQQGYKKGSEIILIIACEPEDAKIREQKIKKAFKENKKFVQHSDGSEHFKGDCNEMMKIMMDITYGDFTVHHLIGEVQEQQKQIDSLKQENELLKKQLFDLQKTTDICK